MEEGTKTPFIPILIWHYAEGPNEYHHTDGINELCFSPDGTRLFTGSQRQKFLRQADTGKIIKIVEGNKVDFSSDGTLFATIDNQVVRLYLSINGERANPRGLYGHDKDVWSMSFFNKDHRIVTGSQDGEAKIWNAQNGECLLTLKHRDIVRFVAVTSDDEKVITVGKDGVIRIWNSNNGSLIRSINVGGDYQYIAYGLGSKIALCFNAYLGNRIVIWDIESGERELDIDLGQKTCDGLIFAKEKRYLVANCEDGTKVWNVTDPQYNREITRCFSFKPAIGRKDTWLAASGRTTPRPGFGDSRYELNLWNLDTGAPVATLLTENKSGIISLQFSEDGLYLVAGSDNYGCAVMVWILPSDELLNPPDRLAENMYINLVKEYLGQCKNLSAASHNDFVRFIAGKNPQKTFEDVFESERVMFETLESNSQQYLRAILPVSHQNICKL